MAYESTTIDCYEFVFTFSIGGNSIPWCERDVIAGYEKEVKEITDGVSEEQQKESTMRLAWALVHSRQAEDIQRGIDMLNVSLESRWRPHVDEREKLYLLAVGYYRIGDYLESKGHVECCIKLQPDWKQALVLKETIEDTLFKDQVVFMIILGLTFGFIARGIFEALDRKK